MGTLDNGACRSQEQRLWEQGEADHVVLSNVVRCVRLQAMVTYNPEEDEFEADTGAMGRLLQLP